MKLCYKIQIENPSTHQVRVVIKGNNEKQKNKLDFFLPRWSPGSYLMREYSRHLSQIKAESMTGQRLSFEQVDISTFELTFSSEELKKSTEFEISYNVYCHELTVRTSHVDDSHAFLHLPTLLMGVLGEPVLVPELEVIFPTFWSKISTGLKDISKERNSFIYQADNYDDLIDSPIEIGNQDTDGFKAGGIDHDLAFYGANFPHAENIKNDTKKIVEHIAQTMGGYPYEKYTFITHFVPGLYGGLEHNNSTALQYCPTQITNRKGYINYLALVSHEYFHTWNVKRIRPKELGPFNYLKEATTPLLWLAEGLTSLMDELFVYRAGLISLEEYLEMQKDNINRYLSVPGKKFHSLNESSFNAWIKLYRPDENTNNSSVSYYLKGGIVFFALHLLLVEKGKKIDDLLKLLWDDYKNHPERGVCAHDVYKMIESIAGVEIREKFEAMTSTTNEIDLESLLLKVGVKCEWDKTEMPWLGFEPEFNGDRVIVKSVTLDGPAYKSGLNSGDEILAINSVRVLKDRFNDHQKFIKAHQTYTILVSRLSRIVELRLNVGITPQKLKALSLSHQELAQGAFQ